MQGCGFVGLGYARRPVPGTAALPPEVPVIPVAGGKREDPNGEPGAREFRAGARSSPPQLRKGGNEVRLAC